MCRWVVELVRRKGVAPLEASHSVRSAITAARFEEIRHMESKGHADDLARLAASAAPSKKRKFGFRIGRRKDVPVRHQERVGVGYNSVVLPSGRSFDVFVATYSDDANTWLCHMLLTALQHNISVKILGFDPALESRSSTYGWADASKFQSMRRMWALEKELASLSDQTLVLWVDADTSFEAGLAPIVQEYVKLSIGSGLVWSAEKQCWPHAGYLCDEFKRIEPVGYKYSPAHTAIPPLPNPGKM